MPNYLCKMGFSSRLSSCARFCTVPGRSEPICDPNGSPSARMHECQTSQDQMAEVLATPIRPPVHFPSGKYVVRTAGQPPRDCRAAVEHPALEPGLVSAPVKIAHA
jgi:hypothetical protein